MLIGLKGYKGVGKDTVADYLVTKYDYTKVAFADILKDAVAGLFGISRAQVDHYKDNQGNTLDLVEVHLDISVPSQKHVSEYVYTWREFLQRFGTEMGREVFGQDFWVDQLFRTLPLRKEQVTALSYTMHVDGDYVISDTRFENEATQIKRHGGHIIEIVRPGYEPDGHSSEEPLPEHLIDARIENNDDLRTLYNNTDKVLNELR